VSSYLEAPCSAPHCLSSPPLFLRYAQGFFRQTFTQWGSKTGEPAAEKATALARAKVIQEILQSQYKDVLANKGNPIVIKIEGDVYVDGQCDQGLAKIDPNNYGQTCRLEDSVNKVKEDPIMLQTKHRSAVIKIVGSK
jgi:hypothetical protein